MPIPATTGQLRSRIGDMEIGDYIVCNYTATSGSVGTFSNLGGAVTSEIPVTGAVSPNGSFYLIKVDKGLLIADRVVQTNITWGVLNAGKFIEGSLSQNVALNKPVTASSYYSSSYVPANLVNGVYDTFPSGASGVSFFWADGTTPSVSTPPWVIIQLDSPQLIRWVGFNFRGGSYDYIIKDVRLTFSDESSQIITLPNPNPIVLYLPISPVITESIKIEPLTAHIGSPTTYLGIGEFEAYSYLCTIRSLTGGVSFADADGNMVTSNQGHGGWPVINEWDTYIRTSTLKGTVTANDKNVWHHKDVGTFVQDTPIIQTFNGTSTPNERSRVYRGLADHSSPQWDDFNYISAEVKSSTIGFRPVFEYK